MSFAEFYENELKNLDLFAVIVYLGSKVQSQFNEDIANSLINQLSSSDPDVRRFLDSGNTNYKVGVCAAEELGLSASRVEELADSRDASDELGLAAQHDFSDARIISKHFSAVYSVYDGERFSLTCFLVFPRSTQLPRYLRIDHSYVPTGFLDDIPMPSKENTISKYSDIRAVLACRGFQRIGTIAAGSPGWGNNTNDRGTRNGGTLNAVWNDFHVLTSLLPRFNKEGLLPGATISGLIQQSDLLLSVLRQMANSERVQTPFRPQGLDVNVLTDISIARNSPLATCLMIGNDLTRAKFGIPTADDYILPACIDKQNSGGRPYILFMYAGHGTQFGELAIEKKSLISPEQIFEISYESGIPFLIILDMCYSHFFGEQYAELMDRHKFPGVVICATSGSNNTSLKAYEHQAMKVVARPKISFRVQETNEPSRGVFSSAFIFALMQLSKLDYLQHEGIQISIDELVTRLVSPYCEFLVKDMNIPAQIPIAY